MLAGGDEFYKSSFSLFVSVIFMNQNEKKLDISDEQ